MRWPIAVRRKATKACDLLAPLDVLIHFERVERVLTQVSRTTYRTVGPSTGACSSTIVGP